MKRWLVVALVAAAMALVPTSAGAEGSEHSGGGKSFGPYSSTSPDSGTCGNDWAIDTFKRVFFVQKTGANTWRVTEAFVDGHFVTAVGPSPGACETVAGPDGNGHTVLPGKIGTMGGIFNWTVTSNTYTPNACDAVTCATTDGFNAAVFGAGPPNITTWYFDYRAQDQGLIYRHWINASANLGGNRGDIASL
jgi:hypothetical protein